MKMTVITDKAGNVLGTMPGHASEHSKATGPGWHSSIVAGPEQHLHEIVVPDELATLKDAEELHRQVKAHLPKS
jgi:hypothetical protein